MRLKNKKATRRALSFYAVHFGLREPFTVLVDGTYLSNATVDALSTILPKIECVTTKCILEELKELQLKDELKQARKMKTLRCSHESAGAEECIIGALRSMVKTPNPAKPFAKRSGVCLATRQKSLVKKVQCEFPSVPIIYAGASVHILPPAEAALDYVKQKDKARLLMEMGTKQSDIKYEKFVDKSESELLNNALKSQAQKESEILSKEQQEMGRKEKGDIGKRLLHINGSSMGRRKGNVSRRKAKAPNPLSCKPRIRQAPPEKKDDAHKRVRTRTRAIKETESNNDE